MDSAVRASGRLPPDGKCLQSVNDGAFHPLQLRYMSQGEPRQAGQQCLQRNPGLQPGKGRAEAKVDAVAERQMTVGVAVNVEPGRPLELLPVAVGGPDPGNNRCPGRDSLIAQNRLCHRHSVHGLNRRPEPQYLFEGLGKQGRLLRCSMRARKYPIRTARTNAWPVVDGFSLYGLIFLDPLRIGVLWLLFLSVQFLMAAYAFRLGPLWTLPLQQFVYQQLMYLVVIQAVVTAAAGVHLRWHRMDRWHRMERYGSLRVPQTQRQG